MKMNVLKRIMALLTCLAVICCLLPSMAEEISITGKVTEIEQYGHVKLDITIEDFGEAGFELGDVVAVKAGSFEGDAPCLNGYYVDRGECMIRAYPGREDIAVCINYGKFAETAGLSVGDPVTLTLKEKGGALALQEINNLVYTNERADYASDEVFANFHAVIPGKLYRSASPVDNRNNRAEISDRLLRAYGIRTVMNMANTEEELETLLSAEDFASPGYRELVDAGSVIPLGMAIDFASDDFAGGIVRGLTFLSGHETPYLVHCTEGKDRGGFGAMILEMLAGFTADEIIDDYMLSYTNYYGILAGTEKYAMIADKNIKEMMILVAGAEKGTDLDSIDWKAAAEQYLAAHGMSADTIAALEAKLSRD